MKTDLQKFIELYESFGITLKPCPEKYVDNVNLTITKYYTVCMNLPEDSEYNGASDKFCGYSGFFSEVRFDEEGKFISQGFYE